MWVDDAKFRWRLAKLQRSQRKNEEYYNLKITAAREIQEREEEQKQQYDKFVVLDKGISEIRSLQHRYITRQAEQLLIPIPECNPKSESWLQSDFDGRWRLTDDALDALSQRVRRERRERVELLFLWPSAFIGFIGGLVGIVSAIFF